MFIDPGPDFKIGDKVFVDLQSGMDVEGQYHTLATVAEVSPDPNPSLRDSGIEDILNIGYNLSYGNRRDVYVLEADNGFVFTVNSSAVLWLAPKAFEPQYKDVNNGPPILMINLKKASRHDLSRATSQCYG